MTASNFSACFEEMEKFEGFHQFSNNPHDPGGATESGLTQRSYDAWRRKQGLPIRSVRVVTDDELQAIYRSEYWTQVRGDELYPGLDLVLFDTAVNEGAVQATRDLQRALGVSVDGVFGLETLGAIQNYGDKSGLIHAVCARRMSFWRSLKTWVYFGKGWAARGEDIEARAIAMLKTA